MVHRPSPLSGRDVLDSSRNLVIKIGGENAVRLSENFSNARRRIERGQDVTFIVSAFRGGRNGGFNTTSQLIDIAHALREGNVPRALSIAGTIDQWTRCAIEMEIERDASLAPEERRQLAPILLDVLREEVQVLRLHLLSHAHGQLHALKEDWVLHSGEYFSITGWGEHLAQLLYRQYCEFRGIASAAVRIGSAAHDVYGREPQEVLRCEQLCNERLRVLRNRVRDQIVVLGHAGYRLSIYPGHFPLLSTERGYSDTGAALVSQAMVEARGSVACLVRKVSPVMDRDPKSVTAEEPAHVVRHLTYAQAMKLMAPGGDAAGVVHPRALGMFSERNIPVVVCSPQDEQTDRTTLIS